MNENKIANDYIQFSKRVTRWGIILVSCALILCLGIIAIFSVEPELCLYYNYGDNYWRILGKQFIGKMD